jgi:DNA-binding GntR family transcriptional regulator
MVNYRRKHRGALGSMKEKVYLALKERILTQELPTGEPLKEVHLARELGVSRTPIREALAELHREDFVEIIPNRGAYVKFISVNDLRETFQLLKILEGAATKIACDQVDQHELERLEQEFLLLQERGERISYKEEQTIGIQLHELILNAVGNTKIVSLLSSIREQVRALCLISIKSYGRASEAVNEHLEIIAALKGGDSLAAERAIVSHLDYVYKNLLKFST